MPVHCSTVNILPVHVLVFSTHTRDISATKGRGAGSAANYSNRPRNYTAPSVNRLVAERTDAAWSGPGIRKPRSAETTILPACRRRLGGDCSNSRCLPAATHAARARLSSAEIYCAAIRSARLRVRPSDALCAFCNSVEIDLVAARPFINYDREIDSAVLIFRLVQCRARISIRKTPATNAINFLRSPVYFLSCVP